MMKHAYGRPTRAARVHPETIYYPSPTCTSFRLQAQSHSKRQPQWRRECHNSLCNSRSRRLVPHHLHPAAATIQGTTIAAAQRAIVFHRHFIDMSLLGCLPCCRGSASSASLIVFANSVSNPVGFSGAKKRWGRSNVASSDDEGCTA